MTVALWATAAALVAVSLQGQVTAQVVDAAATTWWRPRLGYKFQYQLKMAFDVKRDFIPGVQARQRGASTWPGRRGAEIGREPPPPAEWVCSRTASRRASRPSSCAAQAAVVACMGMPACLQHISRGAIRPPRLRPQPAPTLQEQGRGHAPAGNQIRAAACASLHRIASADSSQVYLIDGFEATNADVAVILSKGFFPICYFSAGSYEDWVRRLRMRY
jgi:hypothetical protein